MDEEMKTEAQGGSGLAMSLYEWLQVMTGCLAVIVLLLLAITLGSGVSRRLSFRMVMRTRSPAVRGRWECTFTHGIARRNTISRAMTGDGSLIWLNFRMR